VELAEPLPIHRGDELGAFLLGSTVVMLMELGRGELLAPPVGCQVTLGEPVVRLCARGSEAKAQP
jgi:hypothetical protein